MRIKYGSITSNKKKGKRLTKLENFMRTVDGWTDYKKAKIGPKEIDADIEQWTKKKFRDIEALD